MAKQKSNSVRLNRVLSRLVSGKPIPVLEIPRLWNTAKQLAETGASDEQIALVLTPMIDSMTVQQ